MAIAASVLTDAHTATWFIYGAVLQVDAPRRQPEFEKKIYFTQAYTITDMSISKPALL